MFRHYYLLYYKDLKYTLKECGITLDEYRKGQKQGKKLYLLNNCVSIYGKRKEVAKKIDEFLQEQRIGGNEVDFYFVMRVNQRMALEHPILF